VIIDGSGPMEAFGLREANDIDIISECELTAGRYFDVRSLNELQKLYGNRVDELNSPENYFYFFGLKFVSLNKIVEGKKHRGENKDLSDVKLINEFLRSNNISALSVFKERYRRKKMILWRDIKRNLKNTKRNLKNALNKMGLLNIVKKLIRK
jgi:predicted nucleotidyltransferase